MKVFFDNCTSPVLASTLGGYIKHLGHEAQHICCLPCGRNADDLDWIKALVDSGENWVVITGDLRIQRNKAERAAFRQAGLKGFVLAPAFQKSPQNEIAAMLVWRWPKMEELLGLIQAPALYELPVNRSSAFRSLPL